MFFFYDDDFDQAIDALTGGNEDCFHHNEDDIDDYDYDDNQEKIMILMTIDCRTIDYLCVN